MLDDAHMVHVGNGISVNLGWGSKTKPHQLKVGTPNTTIALDIACRSAGQHGLGVLKTVAECCHHVQGRNKADKELEAIAKAEVRPIDDWDLVMDSRNCRYCCCLVPFCHPDVAMLGLAETWVSLTCAADPSLIKDLPHSIHKVNSKGDGGRAEGDFWCVHSSYSTAVCRSPMGVTCIPESTSCLPLLHLPDAAFYCYFCCWI